MNRINILFRKYFRTSSIIFLTHILMTNAGYLHIEDEDSIRRVANNVFIFWSTHEEAIFPIAHNELETIEGNKILDVIRKSSTGIAEEFRKNKKSVINDLQKTIQYVQEKKTLVETCLGREEYKKFYNGLLLLNILSNYF